MKMKIDQETRVELNFSLKLDDGQVVDSNFSDPPVSFEVGDGKLLPGFESRLYGLSSGEEAVFLISANDAFGPYNEENIQVFNLDQFSEQDDLQLGLVINFVDAANGEVPGVIKEITNDKVHVDFNHPLAGRDLTFEVKIHAVQPKVSH